MKNISLITILSLLFSFSLHAQSVSIIEDGDVSDLLRRYVDENRSTYYVSGYRIQLLSTTDRRKVESEETKFLRDHPDINVDWEHAKPYYKLRVGAFATKLEATRLLIQLKQRYTGAFLTKVNLSMSELVSF